MISGHDDETLAFYDREASAYAAHASAEDNPRLERFLSLLRPGATILELGCGGGRDAEQMLGAGFDVIPTDGSPGLAAEAERRLGRPVRLMRFDELDAVECYDAVWANACLLHAPQAALPDIFARIRRALKTGGLFYASFKAGDGADRDRLGRYNNFVSRVALQRIYQQAGPWSALTIEATPGGGYDNVARTWLLCLATKA